MSLSFKVFIPCKKITSMIKRTRVKKTLRTLLIIHLNVFYILKVKHQSPLFILANMSWNFYCFMVRFKVSLWIRRYDVTNLCEFFFHFNKLKFVYDNFVTNFTDRRWLIFHTVDVKVLNKLNFMHVFVFSSFFEMMNELTKHPYRNRVLKFLFFDNNST